MRRAQPRDDLFRRTADAERRAELAEAHVAHLQAELDRLRQWRRSALIAVVIVALMAILMLGIVAFNAVDDRNSVGALAALLLHT